MVMSAINIKQQITQVILQIIPDITSENLQEHVDIFNLGLDSINAMTLVSNLQDVFDIQLDPNEISFENFQNIATIAAMVEQKKGF
ncbi:D-alanine--poly(phosphoribitol) ligase subunit 2 [Scytonema sp. HK-05]|uniref:acyl carrier protein n=1 Tax=Scytonema sp. HK-05 TaxID=1137095 RepID=UPI000A500296|nr:acyl carrier protein [Scytonema sp. HK-05]BAY48761.1 D-alanine--poly(phosphoribitol) ligase subunit 2 [Scytonema sp. HK-05]